MECTELKEFGTTVSSPPDAQINQDNSYDSALQIRENTRGTIFTISYFLLHTRRKQRGYLKTMKLHSLWNSHLALTPSMYHMVMPRCSAVWSRAELLGFWGMCLFHIIHTFLAVSGSSFTNTPRTSSTENVNDYFWCTDARLACCHLFFFSLFLQREPSATWVCTPP